MEDILKKLIKNEEVMELLRKANEKKTISYEEINESLGDDVSTKEIEQLINGMIEHGIKIKMIQMKMNLKMKMMKKKKF